MRSFSAFARCVAFFVLFSAGFSRADPIASKLVPLIPPGACMISGYENHHGRHVGGHITMATRNNRLDLNDWQALAGVDPGRVYDEAIEVVVPSSRGMLAEHLLLVGGRFSRDLIFRSAEKNGSGTTMWKGEKVLLVKAYAREKDQMKDERWLVILDDRIALLGTPPLVQEALERQVTGASIEPVLLRRLRGMAHDVSSWNVLDASITRAGALLKINPVWIRLLQGTDVLLVGVHFGSHIRVDFMALGERSHGNTVQPQDFANVFRTPESAGDLDAVWQNPPRLEHVVNKPEQVAGSVTMSTEKFESWGVRVSTRTARSLSSAPLVTTGSD